MRLMSKIEQAACVNEEQTVKVDFRILASFQFRFTISLAAQSHRQGVAFTFCP